MGERGTGRRAAAHAAAFGGDRDGWRRAWMEVASGRARGAAGEACGRRGGGPIGMTGRVVWRGGGGPGRGERVGDCGEQGPRLPSRYIA